MGKLWAAAKNRILLFGAKTEAPFLQFGGVNLEGSGSLVGAMQKALIAN